MAIQILYLPVAIGCELMEPTLGRMKLESLAEYDDHDSGFMIIHTFDIDDTCKNKCSSDVETAPANYKRHPQSRNAGCNPNFFHRLGSRLPIREMVKDQGLLFTRTISLYTRMLRTTIPRMERLLRRQLIQFVRRRSISDIIDTWTHIIIALLLKQK